MQAVSGRTRESGKRPRLTSGLRSARCWGRTVSIDSEVRTLDHLNAFRHAHPSAIPTPAPFPPLRHSHPCAIPTLAPFPPLRHSHPCAIPTLAPFPPFRHSHPSAIPTLPSFLRPLRHSCGGRNPCDRPTVRRASIRPTAHQSPQRAARDRAPSNIGSALCPTDRMDSCLRRNDGQAGVTEGAPVCRTPVRLSHQRLPSQREPTSKGGPHASSPQIRSFRIGGELTRSEDS